MRCGACSRAARGGRSGRSPRRSRHRLLPEKRPRSGGVPRRPDRLVAQQAAVAKRQHPTRILGDIRLVSDEDDRDALAVQLLQEDEDLDAGPGVEVARRLVGQQYRGVVDERACDGDTLLLPPRELARMVVGAILEPDRGQPLARARAPRSSRQPRVDQRELDVFEGARPGQEVVCLEDEPDLAVADPCELGPREAGDILAVQDVPAGRGRVETAEKVHEGGLPRARGAHHRHELAALDLDRQAAERMNRVWAESIVLRELLGDDQRHGSAPDAGRAPALARFLPAAATTVADNDFLPRFEVASEDLGRAAVGEAEPERHGLGSPSGPRIHTRPPTPLRPSSPVERSDLDLRSLDLSSLDLVSPPGGRNRRAAFATLSTLGFSATISFTFAVIPGRRCPSGLSTATITV